MTAEPSQALSIVRQWHEALNNHRIEELTALVHEDVQINGPRGSTAGKQVLLEWVERAKVRLIPKQYFTGSETVVVEQLGEWQVPQAGEASSKQMVASVFTVKDGRISSIMRYNDLAEALAASGLNRSK